MGKRFFFDEEQAKEILAQIDLLFVLDTTASMQPFIDAAKDHIVRITQESTKEGLLLNLGMVEYRDHPPQDISFVFRSYPFTNDLQQFQSTLNQLRANGGGDEAEAVLDGVQEAIKAEWREYASRVIWLIGDSPPHGFGSTSDMWSSGCPCGLTIEKLSDDLLNARITLNAVTLTAKPALITAFKKLTQVTNGLLDERSEEELDEASVGAMDIYASTNLSYINELNINTRVYRAYANLSTSNMTSGANINMNILANEAKLDITDVTASWSRLKKRGIIK